MKTQSNRIEELREKHAHEMAKAEKEMEIAALIPEGIKLPIISNISENGKIAAWLSFYPEYGQDAKVFALSIFTELEKAGAVPMPASLCK